MHTKFNIFTLKTREFDPRHDRKCLQPHLFWFRNGCLVQLCQFEFVGQILCKNDSRVKNKLIYEKKWGLFTNFLLKLAKN